MRNFLLYFFKKSKETYAFGSLRVNTLRELILAGTNFGGTNFGGN